MQVPVSDFSLWADYFEPNVSRQQRMEHEWDLSAPVALTNRQRRALIRSFQRFELGEGGEGLSLLAKAAAAGDPVSGATCALHADEANTYGAPLVAVPRVGMKSATHYLGVPIAPTGTVSVATTATSVKFTVVKPGYFDAVGSTIEFSTYQNGGVVYLQQTGQSVDTNPLVWIGVKFGLAYSAWQIQADNLRNAVGR